jgi:hypothetical protein
MNVSRLTNEQLLQATSKLRHCEREVLAELVLHLAEVKRRKIYRDYSYNSLFTYIVEDLGYCRSSAYRWVQAVRLFMLDETVYVKLRTGKVSQQRLVLELVGLFQQQYVTK